MARLNPTLLNCTAFLYRDEEEARSGSMAGGTAFNLCAEYSPGSEALLVYVVTAGHCVRGGYTTVRANALGGGIAVATIPDERWHHHKDGSDVAVAAMRGFDRVPDFTHLPVNLGVQRGFDLGIGDAVFMLGRLIGVDGRDTNLVSLRFGNISMIPSEPIPASKGLTADQEALVVEMRSIGGYSGSPVFVYDDTRGDDPFLSSRLLGLDYCHFNTLGETGYVNSGHAGVVPAWKIWELLHEDEDVLMERREIAEREGGWTRVREGGPMVELDTGDTRPGPEPERLQIDSTAEDVAKRVMDAGKPDASEEPDD